MDSLIAGFIQFSSAIAKSLFLQSEIGQWIDYACTRFRGFTEISSFPKSLSCSATREVTRTLGL